MDQSGLGGATRDAAGEVLGEGGGTMAGSKQCPGLRSAAASTGSRTTGTRDGPNSGTGTSTATGTAAGTGTPPGQHQVLTGGLATPRPGQGAPWQDTWPSRFRMLPGDVLELGLLRPSSRRGRAGCGPAAAAAMGTPVLPAISPPALGPGGSEAQGAWSSYGRGLGAWPRVSSLVHPFPESHSPPAPPLCPLSRIRLVHPLPRDRPLSAHWL